MKFFQLIIATVFSATVLGHATSADQASGEASIRASVEAYVVAFNSGDSSALAAMWSPEAVYTNPVSGEQVVGREAIAQQFASIFAEETNAKLAAKTESVQFISPGVAIEHGTASVVRPDEEPVESEYTAVYVKRDGEWLLDRVTESDVPLVMSNEGHLKELEWMIGNWVDDDDQAQVLTRCQWTKNRNFITRMSSIVVGEQVQHSGIQIIGWDPIANNIRSWVFDSNGEFGEGYWSQKGETWQIQSTATLPDGSKTSSTNIVTYVNDDTFTWQSINRAVDGELLPNVDEVVVVRQGEPQGSN